MVSNEEHLGFVTYSHARRHKRIPFGIVSETENQKATVTHYKRKISEKLITIEDKRYFLHPGFDLKSISRALFVNIRDFKIAQGGSTLTQQLARNLLNDNSVTFNRKVKEILYAILLEWKYTKEEILDLYFDNIYWGQHLYGIRSASFIILLKNLIYYLNKNNYFY